MYSGVGRKMVIKVLMVTILIPCLVVGVSVNKTFVLHANLTSYMPTMDYMVTGSARSLLECGTLCIHTLNCTSFFYDRGDTSCQLHETVPSDTFSMVFSPYARCYVSEEAEEEVIAVTCGYGTYQLGSLCYYFDNSMKRNFNDSKTFCLQSSGEIVKIDSEEEHLFIREVLMNNALHDSYFIGLNDLVTPDDYRWSDGENTAASYLKWGHGNPETSMDCTVMKGGDGYWWHSSGCDSLYYVVCMKPGF